MVSPTRRSLLKLAAAASAYGMVPRMFRGWLSKRQPGGDRGLVDPVGIHTYEEGVDQQPVARVDGIVSIVGTPAYSAGDAVHGSLGWRPLAGSGGGALIYANPNPGGSSGSLYVTPRAIEKSPASVAAFLTDAGVGSPAARIRLRSDMRADVVDAVGTRLALSAPCWLPDHTIRLDWRQTTTGASTTLAVWIYVGLNIEGWRPDLTMTATLPAARITQVAIGSTTDTVMVGFDTYREYDCATIPAPYEPQVGSTAVHTFDDGADGDPVIAGVDLVQGVSGNPVYSGATTAHGPLSVLIPSTPQGGLIMYDVPYPPAHTGSLYLLTALRGTQDSRLITVRNGAAAVAQIFQRPSGSVCIKDAAGKVQAESKARCRVGDWTRIDWQATWDGAALALSVHYFSNDPDTDSGYVAISASIACAVVPDTLAVGTPAGTWRLYFDTLRTYGDVSAWPPPFDPEPTQVFSLLGDPAVDGVTVSSMVLNLQGVDLAVSTMADMSDPIFAGQAAVDVDHLVKHQLSGLRAGTLYYGRLVSPDQTMFGDPLSFTTLPDPTGPMPAWRIALVSCQSSSAGKETSESGWQQMLDWDPHLVVHGGDFGYWGVNLMPADPYQKHLTFYRQQIERLPVMRNLLMTRPSLIQVSDHETSADNGDNYNDPVTTTALVAFQKLMPTSWYADPRDPIRGRFMAFNLNANIRVISIDFRSLDRSPGHVKDNSQKTALGAVQMQWLTDELTRPEALKIIASDPAWGPADPPPSPQPFGYLDKWWNYQTSQRAIAKIVTKQRTSTGGPINVDLWGNDRHLLGYLAGAHNAIGGFPVLCGSGIDQHALPLFSGECYDHVFGCSEVSTPRSQYMKIELTDDGDGTITRTATAWDCVTDSAAFSAVDTWTY